ncbi:MAG: hypothetical protein IJ719_00250 [Clostridia bacterium]|nr:hypothetical protein [Clostridia bacterium]
MDDQLQSFLEKDETIILKSQPEPFETLDQTHKTGFYIKAVVTTVICIALIIGYCSATLGSGNFKIALPIVIAGIGIVVILSTFMDARKIRKQKFYITNQRLIWENDGLKGIPYKTIDQYKFDTDADHHTSLLIGVDAVHKRSSKWRTLGASSVFNNMDTGICEQAVFYAISNPSEFKAAFEKQMKA